MLPEYFEFLNPVKMLCGSGALENIPYELDRLGVKKPLALVSRTLLEEGVIERIGGKLEAVIQSDVPKDSSFSLVDSIAQRAREEGCDGVLAIGGGSVLGYGQGGARAALAGGEDAARHAGQRVAHPRAAGAVCDGAHHLRHWFGVHRGSGGAGRPQPSQAGDRLRPVSARRGGVGPAQHQKPSAAPDRRQRGWTR